MSERDALPPPEGLTRREALGSMALMVGLPGWLTRLIEQAAKPGARRGAFLTVPDLEDVTRLCDAILPATPEVGGALAAGVPGFIDALLAESEPDAQHAFGSGLSAVTRRARTQQGGRPAELTEMRLGALVASLDAEVQSVARAPRMACQEDYSFVLMPSLDTAALGPEARARVEFHLALRCLVLTGYVSSPLFTPTMFHAGYAGCQHPEHHGPEGD